MARFKVLANSLPRGGPFLLAGALELLGYARHGGPAAPPPAALNFEEVRKALRDEPAADAGDAIEVSLFAPWPVAPQTLRRWLDAVSPGHYFMAHLGAAPALPELLAAAGYRCVTILRDPGATLAALLFDESPMPRFLRGDFAELSPGRQLDFMWNGGPVARAGVVLKPFAEVYRSMLAWRRAPGCLTVRFEDLAGEAGGGDAASQREALERLAAYLETPCTEARAARPPLIDDPSTRTFQIRQRAAWATVLGAELAARIDARCEPLRREAGYDP